MSPLIAFFNAPDIWRLNHINEQLYIHNNLIISMLHWHQTILFRGADILSASSGLLRKPVFVG
jgi:hypothetical protein